MLLHLSQIGNILSILEGIKRVLSMNFTLFLDYEAIMMAGAQE